MSQPVTVLYWRDIPAQVLAGSGRGATRLMLADRFQEAIDRAATRAGLIGSDAYTAEWRKVSAEGDIKAVAAELEESHPDTVLHQLVANYGAWSD